MSDDKSQEEQQPQQQQQQHAEEATSSSSSSSSSPAEAPAAAPTTLHPLASKWCLWYKPESHVVRASPASPATAPAVKHEEERIVEMLDTVEQFWSILDNLPSTDKLGTGEALMFFRYPTKPAWEDPTMADGETHSFFTDSVDGADKFIERFMMLVVSELLTKEQFNGKRNVIAGLRYSARKKATGRQFKLDVWTTDATLRSEVTGACKAIAERAGIRNVVHFANTMKENIATLKK